MYPCSLAPPSRLYLVNDSAVNTTGNAADCCTALYDAMSTVEILLESLRGPIAQKQPMFFQAPAGGGYAPEMFWLDVLTSQFNITVDYTYALDPIGLISKFLVDIDGWSGCNCFDDVIFFFIIIFIFFIFF